MKNQIKYSKDIFRNPIEEYFNKAVKKVMLFTLLPAIICALTMGAVKMQSDKSAAQVEQREGIYIFIHSKPAAEFETVGTVKKSVAWSAQPEEMLNALLKKCKKEYPTAEGIIFTTSDMDKADCIKFK